MLIDDNLLPEKDIKAVTQAIRINELLINVNIIYKILPENQISAVS